MSFIKSIVSRKPVITEPSVIFAYSIHDTPGKTMGLKVPRHALKIAKWALTEAHSLTDRQLGVRGFKQHHSRNELVRAIDELHKMSKALVRTVTADYYILGPAAESVIAGLSVGACEIQAKTGSQILTVQSKILTNHECVDVFRLANRQRR